MADTVGDIMIRIRAEASDVKQKMDQVKQTAQNTANSVRSSVQTGTKQINENIRSTGSEVETTTDKANSNMSNFKKGFRDGITYASEGLKNANEQTITTANSVQQAGRRIQQAGNSIKKTLKSDVAMAFTAVGAAALSFSKNCVTAAINSEKEWTRFGALVNQQGGNWGEQESKIKGWARTFSNNMGYATSDTREASLTLMQYGVNVNQLGTAMNGVAALAARTGKTETEAANMIVQAMNGRGNALKRATGINLEDYKISKGKYDMMRLLTDIYKENEEALRTHADTTEAQMQRVSNAWELLKVEMGQAIMPLVKTIADILWTVADAFSKLPTPVKQAIAIFIGLGGAVALILGVVGFLAPAITAIGTALAALSGPVIAVIAIIAGVSYALYAAYTNSQSVRNALNKLASGVLKTAEEGFKSLQEKIQPLIDAWNRLVQILSGDQNGDGIAESFNYIAAAADVLTPILEFLVNQVFTQMGSIIDGATIALNAMGDALEAMAPYVDQLAKGFENLCKWWDEVTGKTAPETPQQTQQQKGGGLTSINSRVQAASGQQTPTTGGGLQNTLQQSLMNISPLASLGGANIGSKIASGINKSLPKVNLSMNKIKNTVRQNLSSTRLTAGTLARNIGTRVYAGIRNIPNQAKNIFNRVKNSVRQGLTNAAHSAREKAKEIYDNIKNKIMEIPQAVSDEFGKIKDRVRSALSSAAAVAASGAANIVSSFLGGLQRHSPGKILRETTSEFYSIPKVISDSSILAIRESGNMASSIVKSWRSNIESFNVPSVKGLEALQSSLSDVSNRNIKLISNDLKTYDNELMGRGRVTNTVNNNDKTVVYNVDKITLECADLTQSQSRKILYDALNGLYTGGV